MGPLLFILYINDLPLVLSDSTSVALYADDATIFTSSPTISGINASLNNCVPSLLDWAKNNDMVLHDKKTKVMAIGTRQRLHNSSEPLNVCFGSTKISNSECEKVLGVYIDSSLRWTEHIDYLIKKLNGKLNVIKRIRHFLPLEQRIILYNALIKPNLEYCCSVWGNCSVEDLNRLLKFQKLSGRLLLNADSLSRSVPLFNTLKWLPIYDIISISKAVLLFKCFHNLAPLYISSQFTRLSDTHSYRTRASLKGDLFISPELCSCDSGRRTFYFSVSTLWNSLPSTI